MPEQSPFNGHCVHRAWARWPHTNVLIDHGYRLMRLDTGNQNAEALTISESLGFHDCLA